ncbi:spore gernimation protein GerPD [Marinicrinis lubricantis]|uniref:Spore gernimation protein GerPD n=1 Tax=Marinicrinis lubricantis TaxID=2086470 RepID=A0ABW1IL13_9BACL
MKLEVTNHQLHVGEVRIIGISTSSIFLIGDTETIQLSSAFDTPAESLIIGPLVPISSETVA